MIYFLGPFSATIVNIYESNKSKLQHSESPFYPAPCYEFGNCVPMIFTISGAETAPNVLITVIQWYSVDRSMYFPY